MSFRTALSGIAAATTNLAVTSNNIANVSTAGFKQGRAEFGDVYAASIFGTARNTAGSGVRVTGITQQFTQGSVEFTNRNLDIAISGGGFFTLSNNGAIVYSRAGNFQLDRDGFVVNPGGARLQVFPPLGGNNPGFETGRLQDLQLTTTDSAPNATSEVIVASNLPANAQPPVSTPFDPNDTNSFNHSTSITVYDSLGVAHVHTLYYVKTANPNEWQLHNFINGAAVGGAQTLQYDAQGALTAPATGFVTLPPWTPPTGAAPVAITMDLRSSTQYGERFAINDLRQDGFTTGRLIGIEVSQQGVVFARYTNGVADPLGQIAMSTFPNQQGLQNLGDNQFAQTFESGDVRRGGAGTADLGLIQSGALESSNVELTEQLVNMIIAQRNFQANAQMIQTNDQIQQTIINLR
ncbi:MAG TPA: flagellar hook protein FlgE [Xanthomonadaceae bacterium]|nr:flagellar hook protein FlgE [Xanthomonadaceae bacterium]